MRKNSIIHFEIGCTDTEATRKFLSGLFDWEFDDDQIETTGDDGSSLSGHLAALGQEWGHYVTVYVRVENLEQSLEWVRKLGGEVLVEPVEPGANLPGSRLPKAKYSGYGKTTARWCAKTSNSSAVTLTYFSSGIALRPCRSCRRHHTSPSCLPS